MRSYARGLKNARDLPLTPVPRYALGIAVRDVSLTPGEVKSKPDAGRMSEDEEKRLAVEFKRTWGSPFG